MKSIEEFVQSLAAALGDDLLGVIARKGGARDVIVTVKNPTGSVLRKMTAALRDARRTLDLAPMITTPEEIASAADVFPVRFRAMQRSHTVLHGDDPLAGVEIGTSNLRLRVEQELRNQSLRLRRGAALAGVDVIVGSRLVRTAAERLGDAVAALLELSGVDVGDVGPAEVYEAWGAHDAEHGEGFLVLAGIARGEASDDTDLASVIDGLLDSLAHAAERADALGEAS